MTGQKILFTTSLEYMPQSTGGSQMSTHDLCDRLQRDGWEVAVLARLRADGTAYVSNRMNALLTGLSCPKDFKMGYTVYRGRKLDRDLTVVLKDFRPDLVVIQAGSQVPMARLLIDAKVPFILYIRDVEFDEQITDAGGIENYREILGHAFILANSEFVGRKFTETFGRAVHVLPPLVNSAAYRCTGSVEKNVALFVNPHPFKGVDTVYELAKNRKDVAFRIIESWPLKKRDVARIRGRVAELANVEFRHYTSDLKSLYRDVKVVLMPSTWQEAWGRVATEAQLNGIPVLASDIGGLPESVGPGGILVNPDAGINAWLTAFSELWDDENRYLYFSTAATDHAARPEIQADAIFADFKYLVESALTGSTPDQ